VFCDIYDVFCDDYDVFYDVFYDDYDVFYDVCMMFYDVYMIIYDVSPCGPAVLELLEAIKSETMAPGNEILGRFAAESTVPKIYCFEPNGSVYVYYINVVHSHLHKCRIYVYIMF